MPSNNSKYTQETSNGETLYMYEIARDDDGGTNYNFKIRLSLSPGTYYLRVRACNPAITGNYYLNYKRDESIHLPGR